MRVRSSLVIFGLLLSVALPSLYGMSDCGGVGANDFPSISAPLQGETIPASGLFTAAIGFPQTLSVLSIVEVELQTSGGTVVVDVTSAFWPPGQSDFAGVSSANADLDAVALGLVPGSQTMVVRLDADGAGGPAARAVTFEWMPGGGGSCEDVASAALSECFLAVSDATRQCYVDTGSACDAASTAVADARNQLNADVLGVCDDATVQSLGYGAVLTAAGLAGRLDESCVGNAATLAARVFGGPQGAVLADFDGGAGETCLSTVYAESASFIDAAFNLQRDCVLDEGACVPATVNASIDSEALISQGSIDAACPAGVLELIIGLPPDIMLERARTQTECMVSAAHGETDPLALTCAPSSLPPGVTIVQTQPSGLTPLAPGVATQLVLDGAVWGTRCGDGSDYAFWVQLAPNGSSAGNMVTHLQGGGVCVVESQCLSVANNNSQLFSALDDGYSESGILSADPAESAFANWTKMFMPYCTQDVFAGGGALEDFGTVSVERYGAVNARAALRVLRNLVADRMNATEPLGFRPDLVQVVFGGSSAGGFGVMFNLHHALDEERWVHTTAINDAALGLDSGSIFGIGQLGAQVQIPWRTLRTQPPYCLGTDCAIGPVLNAAHSERLLAVPEQQLLLVSNQFDQVQINTTSWPGTIDFINAVRTSYCAAETLPGVRYFLDGIPSTFHTYLRSNTAYYTFDIASTPLVDWVEQAVFDPANLVNLVEEGTLTTAFPGVAPFGCPAN